VKDLPGDRSALPAIKLPEQKRCLNGHIRKVQGMSWGADSRSLIAADQGGKTIIWDALRAMKVKVISKPFTVAVAMHPSRPVAAIGGMDNVVSVWSTEGEGAECSLTRQLERHDGYISSLKFVGDDQMLSAAGDAEIALWDLNSWTVKSTFYGHEGDAACIRFPSGDPGSRIFCTSSSDGTVRVWDLRTTECTHKFDVAGECNGCAFFPNGTAVAGGSHNGAAYLFDLRSQAALQKYSRKNNHVSAIEFSKSGRTMCVTIHTSSLLPLLTFRSRSLSPPCFCMTLPCWLAIDQRLRPLASAALSSASLRSRPEPSIPYRATHRLAWLLTPCPPYFDRTFCSLWRLLCPGMLRMRTATFACGTR
jgi:WD40 repeat protein